jgi:hypothetical protein
MPFTIADPDRICSAFNDFTLKADLLINLSRYEIVYGDAYAVAVQELLTKIETLAGNISIKETQFAQNAIDFNLGSSELAPGVMVGNLKKVGAIEYYDGKPYSSYVMTLGEMKSQLESLLADLAKMLQLNCHNSCRRKIVR